MPNKIKSISLSDFRGIKDERTLDLENSDVIIFYGMNGFGKTSIFDAFEWGLTGKLGRYERYLESGWKLNFNNEKKVLRHKYAETPNAYVKIELTGNIKIGRKVTVQRNNCDYGPGEAIPGYELGIQSLCLEDIDAEYAHNYFSATHFLSQETVNDFITAKRPEDRYKSLSVNFGTTLFDPFENNIGKLLSLITSKEKELATKIEAENQILENLLLQLSTKTFDVNEKVNDFNALLSKLKECGVQTNIDPLLLSEDSSILIPKTLFSDLSEVKALIDQERLNFKEQVASSDYLLENYKVWQEKTMFIQTTLSKQKELSALLINTETLSKESKESGERLKAIEEQKKKYLEQLSSVQLVANEWTGFINKHKAIFILEEGIKNQKKEIAEAQLLLPKLEENSKLSKRKFLEIKQNEERVINFKNYLLENRGVWEQHEKNNLDLENQLMPLRNEFNAVNLLAEILEKFLANTELDHNKLLELTEAKVMDLGLLIDLVNPDLTALKNHFGQLATIKSEIIKLQDSQKLIENNYNSLLNKISSKKKLLEESLDYLSRHSHDQNCPICKTAFSHGELIQIIESELTDKINNETRKLRDELSVLEKKLVEKKKLQVTADIDFTKSQEALILMIRKRFQEAQIKRSELSLKISKVSEVKNKRDVAYSELLSKVSEFFNAEIKQLDAETLKLIEGRLEEIKKSKLDSEKAITLLETNLLNKREDLNSKLARIDLANEEIKSYKDDTWSKINFFLFENDFNIDDNGLEIKIKGVEETLKAKISLLDKDLALLKENIQNAERKTKALLGNSTSPLLSAEAQRCSQAIAEAKKITALFTERMRGLNISQEASFEDLGRHTENIKKLFSKAEEKLVLLSKTADLLKELQRYNESAATLKEKKKREQRLLAYDADKLQLNTLKEKIASVKGEFPKIIETYILSNLDQELFNEIYQSLNPHTRFKKMDFEIQVKNNQVGIGFIAKDSAIKAKPEFLFSSGQLNTFGISVFLSMALRQSWLKLDTIFLDDPIQNLDDINILSFIDFIRGLVDLNDGKKQIILSTHDERFYDLLINKFSGYRLKCFKFVSYGRYE